MNFNVYDRDKKRDCNWVLVLFPVKNVVTLNFLGNKVKPVFKKLLNLFRVRGFRPSLCRFTYRVFKGHFVLGLCVLL